MKSKLVRALSLFVLALLSPGAAFATGVLIPKDKSLPPLAIKHQRVEIDVVDGVANAKISQVFQNSVSRDLEAVFVFPLPKGAAVSDFAMHINGKRMAGEIVTKDKARGIYQDIVRRMKDPGLLEHLGNDLFKVSIYPVPKHGEQRIEIAYSQALEYDGGLYKLIYPLKTGDKASQTLEDFTVAVRLSSQVPLKTIYSPSHEVGINRKGDHKASIGFEEDRSLLDRDFVLYYGVSQKDFGLNLLTYAEPKQDGYFMMMISPTVVAKDDKRVERDVVFAFDTSGSMRGEKIEQAREALKYCIGKLDEGDRFNVLRFSTEAELLSENLLAVNNKNRKSALDFVSGFSAGGGTAIHEALQSGLGQWDEKRPLTLVFLTDGRPTIGETNPDNILKSVAKIGASDSVRLFVFGVGEDLNTHLLDRISGENGGTSQYIRTNEKIDTVVASFYEKISFPVLSHPSLEIDGLKIKDLHPKKLPDLFAGEQITLFGRYQGKGEHAIRLTGTVNGEQREFVYEAKLPKNDTSNHFIPRLWGTRRVGFLLDEIRLRGENSELRDEVVALSSEFGIVTPYTSYLVLESDAEYSKHGIALDQSKVDKSLANVLKTKAGAARAHDPGSTSRGSGEKLAKRDATEPADDDAQKRWLGKAAETPQEERAGSVGDQVPAADADYRQKRRITATTPPVTVPVFPGKDSSTDDSNERAREGKEKPVEQGAATDPSQSALATKKPAARPDAGGRAGGRSSATGLEKSEGADAVAIAKQIRKYKEASAVERNNAPASAVRHLKGKIFYRINGIWTDRSFDEKLKTRRLTYASDKYFEFLKQHPELSKFFALGEQVIIVLEDGSAVIVEQETNKAKEAEAE